MGLLTSRPAIIRTGISRDPLRWCPARGFAIEIRMIGILPNVRLRAVASLIAAYAIALQAVFITLAPMQVRADGAIVVYCTGSGSVVALDGNDPAAPAPDPGKLSCVFCGACAAAAALLPDAITHAYRINEQALLLAREFSRGTLANSHVRDGPARAPPLSV